MAPVSPTDSLPSRVLLTRCHVSEPQPLGLLCLCRFIVMLVVIVVSVFVAYALSDPTIKGEVVSQWVSFKTIMLDR